MPPHGPKPPKERTQTIRRVMIQHLEEAPCTARDLSQLIGIREKDVVPHLEHIRKSLRASGRKLIVQPAQCLSCNFIFKDRRRLSRPGACPECRNTRIDPPAFSIEGL